MASLNIPSSSMMKCMNVSDRLLDTHGAFFSTGPADYMVRIFPLQLALVALLQATIHFLLKPLGTVPVVAQILGGILIGPTCLSRYKEFKETIFPGDEADGLYLAGTLGLFGIMLYMFLLGVKLDPSVILRSTKRERAVGILTFILPMLFSQPFTIMIAKNYPKHLTDVNFPMVSGLMSTTSFHTTISFLAELKILNTELGRLASSSSTISGFCSLVTMIIVFALKQFESSSAKEWVPFIFTSLALILFITIILRKVVIWMIKLIPVGESLKEMHLLVIMFMILGTGFVGEWFGNHCLLGPVILGLVIPDGPPLGSALVDKLDPFVSGLLLPLYFCTIGSAINLGNIELHHLLGVMLIFLLTLAGKLLGTILPCMFYRVPLRDSFTVGLILSTLGTYDVQVYGAAITNVGSPIFSVMMMCILLLATVTSPLVRFLYNPSRRYIVYKDNNLQNVQYNSELRMLVCVYNEENVPTIVNILEASTPTREDQICVYLLHIIELQGRSAPLLISHKAHEKLFDEPTPSVHIINGFKIYEKQNQGCASVHSFTSFTPFFSAHDDICTIALEGRTHIMIIPFHKQWNIDGTTQTCKWSNANKKVLKHAPCSVGILIDRGVLHGARSVLSQWSNYKVGVIFLGDADDRESLCFAMRMAGNQNVSLTVHRVIIADTARNNLTEKVLDEDVINEYIVKNRNIQHNHYKEEVVRDAIEIISIMRTMENHYDLILVGRSHQNYSSILSGLTEWSEYPELGIFGDMFASSDFRGNSSVLVLQQHSCLSRNVIHEDPYQPQNYDTNEI